jgi:thioredoxin-dependent peroxiredoxin
MTLRSGDQAPLFHTHDLWGRRVALTDCYGYPTLVALYRSAPCPLCALRLWYLLRRHHRLYNYVLRLIVLVDSGPAQAQRYLDRFETPVPLVAAHGHNAYDLYEARTSRLSPFLTRMTRRRAFQEARYAGVGASTLSETLRAYDGAFGLLPAEFLLTPTLRIASAHYAKDIGDFLPFAEIDSFVAHYIR